MLWLQLLFHIFLIIRQNAREGHDEDFSYLSTEEEEMSHHRQDPQAKHGRKRGKHVSVQIFKSAILKVV